MTDPAVVTKCVTGIDSREQLQISQKMPVVAVDLSLVQAQASFLASVKLCVSISGLQDNQVYQTLGIDAGQWTRIMKGDAHFPLNKMNALMDYCGNEAPLIWLSFSRGYDLKRRESEIEIELRLAQEEIKRMKMEREVELRLIKDMKVS